MGFMSINNAYKEPSIWLFKELFALEKIDGTTTHIAFDGENLSFHNGGASRDSFLKLFNHDELLLKFKELGHNNIKIHGEGYGGKLQAMSDTYGKSLRFTAFDVKIGETWLNVPNAHDVCTKLGLEFVDYKLIPGTIEAADTERDRPSTQAKRCGITEDRIREGVILRPVIELTTSSGARVIAKHKRKEFMETNTPRDVDPAKLLVLTEAKAVADEWVTDNRLSHVLAKLQVEGIEMVRQNTGKVGEAMLADVKKESAGEIVWSPDVERAIKTKASQMFKSHLEKQESVI